KHPESPQVNLARQGAGTAHYQLGDLDSAQKAYESVPAADRSGDLLAVNFQLADVYLRQAPTKADDAVTAGRLEEKLKSAADLLEAYLFGAADGPLAPDALLKLGYCRQRQAGQIANKDEQRKAYGEARAVYERVQQKFPKSEAFAPATFERAKVMAKLGDAGGAMNELRRFSADPLKKSPPAPMALLALATMQRAGGKPADAAATLDECRKAHEPALAGRPEVALLRYHHAAALREAGKLDEARALFDDVARSFPQRPEGWDAGLRAGQTLKERGERRIAEGRKAPKAGGEKLLADGVNDVRAAVQYLAAQDALLKARKADGEDARGLAAARARVQYEAAWGWRALAEMEVAAARAKLQQERWQRRRDDLSKGLPPGQPPPQVAVPDVPPGDVPAQPAEAQARQAYEGLIAAFPDLAVNADARLELSELLAARGQHAEAVKLLQGALEGDREPSPEALDRIKLRLAACLLDQGARAALAGKADGKKAVEAALEQAQGVSSNDKSKLWQQAVYREAECLLQLGRHDDAVKLLARFRDDGKFHNLPGLTDRALLRLGWALGERKQWEPSRQAYQLVLDRHGSGPWAHEARYGVGWSFQNQGRYDEAVGVYTQVTAAVATELAARAQLNVGLCRLAQKRPGDAAAALLVVPFTYDYPELSGLALLEAARALHEDKQTASAVRLLQRVLRDHPGTPAADAARKRLTDLGEV
ncbi:MAG: tetratricopeptide repeat protein, partial [Gemmataceae bacterium]